MKRTLLTLILVLSIASITSAASLQTVFEDDFTGGRDAAWVVDSGTWADTSYSDVGGPWPGDVIAGQTNGTIHIDFPAYTYDGSANTDNPTGYEWQVTFDYCNAQNHGNSYSQWQVQMGTADEQNAMHLQANDAGNGYGGENTKFAFYRGISSASPPFGTGAEVQWTYATQALPALRRVTFSWEASQGVNGILYMTHSQVSDGLILNSDSMQISSSEPAFNTFSRVSLNTSLIGGKNWWFDNVQVQVAVPEPATMALLALGSLALLRKRS